MSTPNLSAWSVVAEGFPRSGGIADKLRFAVSYAILAPSSHNTQPWRFVIVDGELLLCADRSRSLPVIDPFDRELVISCGAALLNLRIALARFDIPIEITLFPQSNDPDILARIVAVRAGSAWPELTGLFDAIAARSTNRMAFSGEAPPPDLVERLRAAAAAEGVEAKFAHTAAARARVAALIAEADRRQFGDPHFRRELASWIHPSRHDDGMPAYSQGLKPLVDAATPIAAMVIRTFDIGHGVAATHEQLARGSPLLAVLSTTVDDNQAWLATGQALERVLLTAASAGFGASYLNQPTEVPDLRSRLAHELTAAPYPQLILRLGRGPQAPHSPRRPLADVLA
jgi:nitroreductase